MREEDDAHAAASDLAVDRVFADIAQRTLVPRPGRNHAQRDRCFRLPRKENIAGDLFLDAGSGPVQYPEYLTYSEGYRYRVCADISW